MVEHPILLRGLASLTPDVRPTLLQRTDQELIPVLFQQLQAGDDLQPVVKTIAHTRTADGTLKLYQPVQRMFTIVLFEAVCVAPGFPRLDPAVIDSAGVVVRRLRASDKEGWLAQQSTLRGWGKLNGDELQDPDPERRRTRSAGHAVIDRRLALRLAVTAPFAEQVTRLFVAPPAVCTALGKTVLFGLVPVTSSEHSETPEGNTTVLLDDNYTNAIANHMPTLLRSGTRTFALASRTITSDAAAPERLSADPNLRAFVDMLRQLALEFAAFGPAPESTALLAELNAIPLPMPNGSTTPMGDFFKRCTDVLLDGVGQAVTMPSGWPTVTALQAQRILQAVVNSLRARVITSQQGERRFDDVTAQYQLRGFVRVKRKPECPPVLFWSEYSEPYLIAPWYESADNGLPLPQIPLPNPFDRAALRQLKPNVAFKVPEQLFGLLNGNLSKVLDGEKPPAGSGFGLDWICSFSLPIITLCAFLVLNIFLSLFDLIFRWMLFIKICIPIPKKG